MYARVFSLLPTKGEPLHHIGVDSTSLRELLLAAHKEDQVMVQKIRKWDEATLWLNSCDVARVECGKRRKFEHSFSTDGYGISVRTSLEQQQQTPHHTTEEVSEKATTTTKHTQKAQSSGTHNDLTIAEAAATSNISCPRSSHSHNTPLSSSIAIGIDPGNTFLFVASDGTKQRVVQASKKEYRHSSKMTQQKQWCAKKLAKEYTPNDGSGKKGEEEEEAHIQYNLRLNMPSCKTVDSLQILEHAKYIGKHGHRMLKCTRDMAFRKFRKF